jgi:hypothetical protein
VPAPLQRVPDPLPTGATRAQTDPPASAPGLVSSVTSVTSPEDLAREAAMLERARRAMADDPLHPERTLTLLDEHARAFPNGALGQEGEVLRIEALCQGGRTTEGRARARAFLERHRAGLYTRRVGALLERCE